MATKIQRHKTAIKRTGASRPIRLALDDRLIRSEATVFDYGCGHGADLRFLTKQGISCSGWDPVHHSAAERKPADIVNLGYVVNVIENPQERVETLLDAWKLARRALVISARLSAESKNANFREFGDGYISKRDTFQKFYDQGELKSWVDTVLETSCVAAAPGVFYAFRDEGLKESYLASRVRRRTVAPRQRVSDILFEQNRELLESLMRFLTERGRLPDLCELTESERIIESLGSLKRAYAVIRQVTDPESWLRIEEERRQDLLVYLALDRLTGRPKMSGLPPDLQLDVRAFCSNYTRACKEADALLFGAGNQEAVDAACREAPVGKLTQEALYVHIDALDSLPPLLRTYEGCARSYVGIIDEANLVKLRRDRPKVSYLTYPNFEKLAHPELAESLVVALDTFKIHFRDYREATNPPILHRKETFVGEQHPLFERFANLTRQEERRGLYENPRTIGTRDGWQAVLEDKGLRLRGHRVVRAT